MVLAGLAVFSGCGGGGEGEPLLPQPVATNIDVVPRTLSFVALGHTATLTAQVLDQNGNPIGGVAVSWASDDPAIATVDAAGRVEAVANGAVVIQARAGDALGIADVSVQQVPARMEKAGGDGQTGGPHAALPVNPAVRLTDANGRPIEAVTVAFRVEEGGGSVDPAAAETRDGLASTVWTLGGGGPQEMSAAVASATDPPGVRFSAVAHGLTVRADALPDAYVSFPYSISTALSASGGTPPYVWDLAEGGLPGGLALTADGRFDGVPRSAGTFRFTVRSTDAEGMRGTAEAELRVCGQEIDLEMGEPHIVPLDASGRCGFILRADAAGSYFRVTTVGTFEYAFWPPDTITVDVLHAVSDARPAGLPFAGTGAEGGRPGPDPQPSNGHLALREAEGRLLRGLAAEGRLSVLRDRSTAASRAAARAAPPPDTLVIKEGRPGSPTDNCTTERLITTVLAGHTDRLAAYATPDGDPLVPNNVARILQHYEDHGAEVIDAWGGVSDLDGNGRINVYLDSELSANQIAGVVWAGDLLSASECPASNEGELLRMRRDWVNVLPNALEATLVHEAQHLNSQYKRILAGGDRHPTWIEEGRAVLAEEVAARMAWWEEGGPAPNETVTAAHTPALLWDTAAIGLHGIATALSRAKYVFTAQPHWVMGYPDPYGGGWHFHRFLADWYGNAGSGPRAAWGFLRSLVAPEAPAGVAGVAAVTGRSFEQVMTDYAVAFSLAGTGAPARPGVPAFATHDFTGIGYDTPQMCCRGVAGRFPWPVTTSGEGAAARLWAPLSETRTFSGTAGSFRVHDLRASEAGEAAIVRIRNDARRFADPIAAAVIVRIPDQAD